MFRTIMIAFVLMTLVLMLGAVAPAMATGWNLAADFSTTANPNGVWEVGVTTAGLGFASYGNTPYNFYFANQVSGWGAWMSGAVAKNITGGDFVGWTGQHWIPKDGMFIMPTSGSNMMGVAWTSPITGTISVTGRVYGATVIDPQPAAVGPWQIATEGGSVLASGSINGAVAGGSYAAVGNNPEDPFSLLVNVTTGQRLLFGIGDNLTWDVSRFGLDLDIQTIPEPGSMLALGSGLLGLVGFAIRRRK